MKAFILAAGVSRRLYPHTYNTPKCLLDVGGKPIIHYQLEALESLGIIDITMIVGYHREMLIDHVTSHFPNLNFNFIVNHHYFETNTAYSVHLGREILSSDEHVLMNADVVYPKALLRKTVNSPYLTALAVDAKVCGREEVKVIDGGENKIVAIGKELIESQCLGEFIGVAKLSKEFTGLFSKSLDQLILSGGVNDYFEAGIQPLLDKTDVHFEDVSKYPCLEIDFIEDLESARKLF
ncbi:MAG: phosphocholine cytidylyltransferase family protein [Candidatus Marinimicrobia bacterium]|jgi:choline kinase|nr:phosphocholine cytidylyltransferase family protein [Candidatus Neomarinimicrobiota bacterium]MBT3502086.1 phosphocholine cytidylyltransferase family protein [Candidatus Neomarinimicrobiota bacterium]MBT3840471.1 phosphocholine cytidylyltransferase family protein [Candidatus Neomarinimicrobiota bacterium]MBT3999975.1 phosphocholine cytidylyltransferase family protein [Candidatus Neomarinimicrobiota bacterium]MBT4283510.1 phosphocholine cytidylyltransferase family protein [Candidatus Neomarini